MTRALVVVQKNDHSLGFYDPESSQELDRVRLDPYPHEFVLSNDGRLAFCCHFGVALAEDEGPGGHTVSVVDLYERKLIASLDCGAFRRPHDAALDSAGCLYVLSEGTSRLLIAEDPLSERFDRDLPSGGEGSHIVTVTADGNLAFASNMKSGTVTAVFTDDGEREPVPIVVGSRPEGSVLDAEEARLYVTCRESGEVAVIDTRSLQRLPSLKVPPGPVRICWDDRARLLVALYHAEALALVEPCSGRTETIDLPGKPVSIGFDGETGTALLSILGDEVCLVSLSEKRVTRRIATRASPDPLAIVDVDLDVPKS